MMTMLMRVMWTTKLMTAAFDDDGVVAGNYRTSFSGRDLNRKFNELGKFLYPEINGLTNLVKKLKSQHKKV